MESTGKSRSDIDRAVAYHFGDDYLGADLETMKPLQNQVKAVEILKGMDVTKENIYLYGQNRTGKSYLLAAIYREILKKHGVGMGYTEVLSDKQLEKDLVDAQFYGERDFLTLAYAPRRYFIFKDFGKCTLERDLVLTPLFEFFDYIFSNSKSKRFYFASNYLPQDLAIFNDKWLSIATRINEKCRVVKI
jgi:chromosomal replication initiation ATPase DnaA